MGNFRGEIKTDEVKGHAQKILTLFHSNPPCIYCVSYSPSIGGGLFLPASGFYKGALQGCTMKKFFSVVCILVVICCLISVSCVSGEYSGSDIFMPANSYTPSAYFDTPGYQPAAFFNEIGYTPSAYLNTPGYQPTAFFDEMMYTPSAYFDTPGYTPSIYFDFDGFIP